MKPEALLAKNMKLIRVQHGYTQEEVAKNLHIHRSVYAKHESGRTIPDSKRVEAFSQIFQIGAEQLLQNLSLVIPDTSSLFKHQRILTTLLEDFSAVVIPQTVIDELSYQKKAARLKKEAWMILKTIYHLLSTYPDRIRIGESRKFPGNNDQKIIQLANHLSKDQNGTVYILHDDVDFSLNYAHSLLLKDYLSHRVGNIDHALLAKLKNLVLPDWTTFQRHIPSETLNSYLEDGTTLLIQCIRSHISPQDKRKKLEFLLARGADINKTDHFKHCLTPLTHCIQVRDFATFDFLITQGADYNKGSIDETENSYFKNQRINEGNTPLMVAVWQASFSFIKTLCKLSKISYNQQDSNGYTALIKCAVQKQNAIKQGKSYEIYEKIYEYLLSFPSVDPLIHDRNNKKAEDWWCMND